MTRPFAVSLLTVTPVVLGQWLTLDAVLDGVLEAEGLTAEERILPLLAWDGTGVHASVSTAEIRGRGLVHVASAMLPSTRSINAAPPAPGSDLADSFTSVRPRVVERTWKQGMRPAVDFADGPLPFVDGHGRPANKVDIQRGPGAGKLETKRLLMPGIIEWVAQGDPGRVVEILGRAMGIGAKLSAGMGQFDAESIAIEELDDADPLTGIFDPAGTALWRPVPERMLEGHDVVARRSFQTCRSPYWDRSGMEQACIPFARHYDGLLTL